MKQILIILVCLSLVFLTGCNEPEKALEQPSDGVSKSSNKPLSTFSGAYRVEIATEPAQVAVGAPANLVFTVKDETGEIFRDLEIVHEKPMHLLIVSEDLAEFYHEHPEPQADGRLKVGFTFQSGGKYRLYVDLKPRGAGQIVQSFPVSVGGPERAAENLKIDEQLEKTVDGLRVGMKPDGPLESENEILLDFSVSEAESGKPVTDLENYLGEKAHFVVISQDLKEFVHAHPISTDNVKTEHVHDDGAKHAEKMTNAPVAGNTVAAQLAFPKPGIYKLWAQFKRRGEVISVPFVVSVKQGAEQTDVLAKVKIPDDAVKIVVSRDGFTPEEITLVKGKPLKLAFIRTDAENCGGEVVFKDLNITKKLPVGEVVTVDIPENKTGEINFACGMNMLKGKIIVQ